MIYLILQHPGHNRVYYNLAGKLALAELEIACSGLSVSCTDIQLMEIAGVRYIAFTADQELNDKDLNLLARLSFVFAIYTLETREEKKLLHPVQLAQYEYLDEKISSVLKYQGKTNERFTKMMLNVALLSSDFSYSDNINLLDPVAGRGTTLFEGAVYGFNCYGVEIEPKHVQETALFFKKYLETERLKHLAASKQVFGSGKADAVYANEIVYARSKEAFKDVSKQKILSIIAGDAKDAFRYFKKEKFHLIVGDLPYGIVHGNKGAKKSKSITRNPSELLNDCLPGWFKTLKTGGVLVVAWNSFLVSRYKLSKVFSEHGFEVLSDGPYGGFEHMVDKSIKRDIIVAKKR